MAARRSWSRSGVKVPAGALRKENDADFSGRFKVGEKLGFQKLFRRRRRVSSETRPSRSFASHRNT